MLQMPRLRREREVSKRFHAIPPPPNSLTAPEITRLTAQTTQLSPQRLNLQCSSMIIGVWTQECANRGSAGMHLIGTFSEPRYDLQTPSTRLVHNRKLIAG
ncbi:hypothetical protein HBI56_125250 [Parastagonospora nodorum]|uniref:Uncharacterized protein n=1 Tax=Phaeosphaeria nodorum (strain SN15 / ATCC MYA-4574 / FGSC 10173) TaxID=321614 RepID=A0A7U2F4H4_PHANO|nr:hypothetical protein HBH56_166580 [Parastagonospora nodorum]QRC98558.1 hypothetical protein JI435_412280 [Parastagonospora nodorum SN15]KAH3936409.1 hypothetical protein HBH54_029660 [Parastagonospora nodorum]KAH3948423.1 hypothetical protein HBH53_104460 [Parastagonospora nodorum]KAH3968586.1 hypothetical protein HBH51_128370 [Parastagonospora nodorum]